MEEGVGGEVGMDTGPMVIGIVVVGNTRRRGKEKGRG
jgi:hypothetical protein